MKKKKTVLIGLSGGVDSSVAALLLKRKGYNVIGAFIKSFSRKNPLSRECMWIEERRMAEKIALVLGIKLYTFDFEKEYRKMVIEPMFRDYSRGLTPNPDILCNKRIKFPLLWKAARKLNADFIATGHYARIKKTKKGFELYMGKDKTKDQSYFLSELSQEDLDHTLFPIGNLTKQGVREIARKNNFPNHDKKGTRGICFIGRLNLKNFLEKKIKNREGKIIDENNALAGYHPGIFYYTIGQRVGERLGFRLLKHFLKRYYVAEKRKNNVLVIAPEGHFLLKRKLVRIKEMHLINPEKRIPKNLRVRIRHLGELFRGRLVKKKKEFFFEFFKPLEQVAEGQHIVLYGKERVIGGGEMFY